MRFHVVTLFPKLVHSYLSESILARAIKEKKISVSFYNPRDFVAVGKQSFLRGRPQGWKPYLRVDDKPYGGGPGMVMQAAPIIKAVEAALRKLKVESRKRVKIIFFSPNGKKFTTSYAKAAAKKYSDIILICGRYEGVDARVRKIFKAEELSVGDYVLTGGEIPAMILIDCISRQIEGVLGNFSSREEERAASRDVYTRPEILKHKGRSYRVPKVLLSGDHKKIEGWRGKKSS